MNDKSRRPSRERAATTKLVLLGARPVGSRSAARPAGRPRARPPVRADERAAIRDLQAIVFFAHAAAIFGRRLAQVWFGS